MNESRSRTFDFDRVIGGHVTPSFAVEVTQDIDMTQPSTTYGYFYKAATVTTHSRYQLTVSEGESYWRALDDALALASHWNSEADQQKREEGVLQS